MWRARLTTSARCIPLAGVCKSWFLLALSSKDCSNLFLYGNELQICCRLVLDHDEQDGQCNERRYKRTPGHVCDHSVLTGNDYWGAAMTRMERTSTQPSERTGSKRRYRTR